MPDAAHGTFFGDLGIGQSEIGRPLASSELQLTIEACQEAIRDAGLQVDDIDGLVTWPGDVGYTGGLTASSPGFCGPSAPSLKDAMRLQVNWHSAGPEGPAMLGSVVTACMAVASGLCRHVLVYRTLGESTAQHGGGRQGIPAPDPHAISGYLQWALPYGGLSGACWMAPYAQRYFYEYGARRDQLGWIAVNARRNAALNDKAIYRAPLTIDDYMDARMITSPLCLYDCDVPVDASTAVVVSTSDYAKDAPNRAIQFEAIGTALNGRASWDQWEDMTTMGAHDAGAHLWSRTDLKPSDVDVGAVYDGFSILTLLWLEALQLCGKGEAAEFVDGGERISLHGDLPLSTGGGQLSAGRLHSFGHLYEAVTQLRHQGGVRQVQGAETAVVSSGAGPLASCLLLTTG